jgi:HEAT repeat protein
MDDVSRLSLEERRSLYATVRPEQLVSGNDYVSLLKAGLQDADAIVRRNAASQTASMLAAFQRMKREGQNLPIAVTTLPALIATLKKMTADPDPQVRGAVLPALAFSGAPNADVESLILSQWQNETNKELKAASLKALVDAGYRSPRIGSALVSSLSDEERKVRERVARLIAEVKPAGALLELAKLLEDQQMARDSVVQAIAAYGAEAQPYLPQLEKLLNDPTTGGTLPNRIRTAIEAIKAPTPGAKAAAKIEAVALVNASPPQARTPTAPLVATPAPSTPLPTATPAPSSPAPGVAESPSSVVEPKSPVWPWLVGIAALLAIAAFFAKRRG